MSLSSLLAALEYSLRRAGIPSARAEAELIAGHVLGLTRGEIYMRGGTEVAPADGERIAELARRRESRYPLQYLTGECEFRSLTFAMREGVFIPRPETEVLVGSVANALRARSAGPLNILEIGTGSGVISVSLAHALGGGRREGLVMLATDISPEAVTTARRNAARHGLENTMKFAVGDGISFLRPSAGGGLFDVCVCNPPYVATADIEGLAPEVRDYEPRAALDGGEDGLDFVRRMVADLPSILSGAALVALEVAPGQAAAVCDLLVRAGAVETEVVRDLSGRARVTIARMG